MHKRWFLIFWTICSLLMRVHGQVEGIEGLEGLDDEEDDDYDDSTSERQFGGAMRDAVKNFVTGTVKYITNTRLIPSVVSQALRRPFPALASLSSSQSSPTSSSSSSASSAINSAASQSINSLGMGSGSTDNGPLSALSAGQSMAQSAPVSSLSSNGMSTASSSPMAALSSLTGNINALLPFAGSNQIQQASEMLGNVFRNMRSNWARRNQEQQQQIRKRLQSITKRLTSSRVLSSTLHRLTGRHDRSDLKTSESISKPVFSAQNLPQFIPVPYLMPTY